MSSIVRPPRAMHDYYEKMREHLDRYDQSRIRGLSTRDVVAQRYSDSELRQLVTSLNERPLPTMSAFRLVSFIHERQQDRILRSGFFYCLVRNCCFASFATQKGIACTTHLTSVLEARAGLPLCSMLHIIGRPCLSTDVR